MWPVCCSHLLSTLWHNLLFFRTHMFWQILLNFSYYYESHILGIISLFCINDMFCLVYRITLLSHLHFFQNINICQPNPLCESNNHLFKCWKYIFMSQNNYFFLYCTVMKNLMNTHWRIQELDIQINPCKGLWTF